MDYNFLWGAEAFWREKKNIMHDEITMKIPPIHA